MPSQVVEPFEVFGDHEIFEQVALQVKRSQFLTFSNAQKRGDQSRVVEVELRLSYHPLVVITVMRMQQKHDEAGLKHRHPGFHRLVVDPQVVGDG